MICNSVSEFGHREATWAHCSSTGNDLGEHCSQHVSVDAMDMEEGEFSPFLKNPHTPGASGLLEGPGDVHTNEGQPSPAANRTIEWPEYKVQAQVPVLGLSSSFSPRR